MQTLLKNVAFRQKRSQTGRGSRAWGRQTGVVVRAGCYTWPGRSLTWPDQCLVPAWRHSPRLAPPGLGRPGITTEFAGHYNSARPQKLARKVGDIGAVTFWASGMEGSAWRALQRLPKRTICLVQGTCSRARLCGVIFVCFVVCLVCCCLLSWLDGLLFVYPKLLHFSLFCFFLFACFLVCYKGYAKSISPTFLKLGRKVMEG